MRQKKFLFGLFIRTGPVLIVTVLAGLAVFIIWNLFVKIALVAENAGAAEIMMKFWKDLKDPVAGTVLITLASVAIAAPAGIITGIYLHEYAGKRISRFGTDLFRYLSSVPSIIIGVFGLIMIISLNSLLDSGARTGFAVSALSLALLVLPYIVQSTAGALSMVPEDTRLTALSLGAKKYQNILFVLLPECVQGILGGVVLSIGRAAEDTAVIMLTGAAAYAGIPSGLNDAFEALPFFIYYKSSEYQGRMETAEIFIASAIIIIISTVFILAAEKMSAIMRLKMKGEKHDKQV